MEKRIRAWASSDIVTMTLAPYRKSQLRSRKRAN